MFKSNLGIILVSISIVILLGCNDTKETQDSIDKLEAIDACAGIESCSSPADCYTNENLIGIGQACLNGERLRWSKSPTYGKCSQIDDECEFIYGHWYKEGNENIHLVDNLSSQWVQTNKIYVDVSNLQRAENGLYYYFYTDSSKEFQFYSLKNDFGIDKSGQGKNAETCNFVNKNMNNTNVCAEIGMRLPIIRETNVLKDDKYESADSCDYTGGPDFSGTKGVPCWMTASGYGYGTWTASGISNAAYNFFIFGPAGAATALESKNGAYVVCVAR